MSSSSPVKEGKWARKRPVTRARILEAAAAVFEDKGFQRASLDEIAARAGLTKGAVYSNFASKDELYQALLSERPLQLEPKLSPNMTKQKYFRALGEATAALLPQARAQSAFYAEFLLYTLSHEDVRAEWAARNAERSRSRMTTAPLKKGTRLALAPRDMTNVVQALSLGFMFQHMLTPDEITPDLVIKAFDLLAADEAP